MRLHDRHPILLSVLVVALAAAVSYGQFAQADDAKSLLKQGADQFKARKFQESKVSLLAASAKQDTLSKAEKTDLTKYLDEIDGAIKSQQAALEDFDAARKAVTENNLDQAKALLDKVAKSQFVPEQVARDAQAEYAVVLRKMQDAKTTPPPVVPVATPKVVVVQPVAPAVTATPPAAPVAAPVVAPAVSADQAAAAQAALDKAKALVAKAQEALNNDQVDQAVTLFQQAAQAAPGYEPATEGLAMAKSMVGEGSSPLTRAQRLQSIRKQETTVRVNEALRSAREAYAPRTGLSENDFAKARDEANMADSLLVANKSLFTDAEYRALKTDVDRLTQHIETSKAAFDKNKLIVGTHEIEQNRLERERRAERERRDRIAAYKAQVKMLRDEQKYDEAVQVLANILKLDPSDQWAAEWHEQLERMVWLMKDKDFAKTSLREEVKSLVAVRESTIPWYEELRYPKDWPDITRRRLAMNAGESAESDADRAVQKRLRTLMIPRLDLSGLPFSEVVQFLRDLSGVNIYVKWAALSASQIDKTAPVNVKLTDVTFEKALQTVLEDVGGINQLSYVVNDGVITISTKADLSLKTQVRVYDIRDLIMRVPNFVGPRIDLQAGQNNTANGSNGSNGSSGGGGLFGNASSSGNGGSNGGSNGGDTEENAISRQELVNNIMELIRTTIARDSWIDNSGTVGSLREMSGQLIVTQTAENHRAMSELLSQLREVRAMQISIEARFVSVSSSFLSHVGIDLDFYFNIDSRMKPTGPNMSQTTLDPITGARLMNPATPNALLPAWQGGQLLTNKLTPLPVQQGSYDFAKPGQTGVGNNIGSASGSALSVAGTFLDDIQVDFLISATQANHTSRSLTAPRITIWNGQRAYIVVAREEAYVAGLEPIVSENAAAFRPLIQTVATGSTLDVEGTISADRRYVNMTIRPTVSHFERFREYQGSVDANGQPIEGSGTIQLPIISTQRLECTVSVPDGGTLFLGGQKESGEVEKEMGPPLINKIPILNRAFTNRSKVRDESTLLILVKPKIIIQKEYEELNFPS